MSSAAAGDISGPARFQQLWQRCLVAGATDNSADIHRRLLDGYREPQRHYHTLAHIEQCLVMFDQCKSLASDPDALELAVWFHDVIFEPGRPDNEKRSAELYLALSQGVHDERTRGLIDRLIMATLHDGSSLQDHDAVYMVDIDLSSFGLSWEEFLQDSKNLRLESADLSDAEYYRKKTSFQNCLLAKERFYLSDFFAERLENQARSNLARYFDYISPQR
ncbi:MAG: hypothetical protein OEU50_11240 [Gammaproteobacteria bacterium]|nr:hypothetical protein [Gammaproteobacteria bacterium]